MVHTSPSTTTLPSSGISAPESLLVRYVKAHVRKGEQAKDKADQHFVAAGRYLVTLKVNYAPTWRHWEDLLRIKVGLSTGRASELMQIADGRKSLEQVRTGTAKRVMKHAKASSSLANEEKPGDADELFEEGQHDPLPLPAQGNKDLEGPELAWAEEHDLIDVLAGSTPVIRDAAIKAVISGSHQGQFEQVRDAVADLYQRLARAER
jgi:hypothetical protein